jgi:sulfur relay (sulfurtransferase) DsrC/TusE family protein
MAATQCVKEAIWLQGPLGEIGYPEKDKDNVQLFGDNMGALALAQNHKYHVQSKHIDVQWHFVREKIQEEVVTLNYLPTDKMVADGLTKQLGKEKFKQLVDLIGMTTAEQA